MKNIICFLSLCFIFAMSYESKAQVQTMTASTYTVTDTGVINLGLKLNEYWETVSIQYVGTKLGGTVAGTSVLQGSIDGTNYESVAPRMCLDSLNSYTNTNVTTNTKIWELRHSPYLYYRVACTGSGTMSLRVAAYVLPRK